MPPVSDPFCWYVALVASGNEVDAAEHLRAVGFDETFCPHRISRRVVRGHVFDDQVPVIRGYVLCRTDLFTPGLWHLACPSQDMLHHGLVRGFIGGWPAAPVPTHSVEDQMSRCDSNGLWAAPPEPVFELHKPGTLVRLTDQYASHLTWMIIWDDGRGVNVRALHTPNFTVYVQPRERVTPIVEASNPSAPLTVEAQTGRTRRGKRRVRSYHAA